jgi:hypothetical protein
VWGAFPPAEVIPKNTGTIKNTTNNRSNSGDRANAV